MKKDRESASDQPPDRPVNKATMDQPQEEFIDDQSVPSHSSREHDRDHGDEVEGARARQGPTPRK